MFSTGGGNIPLSVNTDMFISSIYSLLVDVPHMFLLLKVETLQAIASPSKDSMTEALANVNI